MKLGHWSGRGAQVGRWAVLIGAIGIVVIGCSQSLVPVVGSGSLPVHKDLDGYPAALLEATLVQEGPCLFAEAGGDRWLALWPSRSDLQGTAVVRDGQPIARVGETVKLGGGEFGEDQYAFVRTLLMGEVRPECRGQRYWLVSEVIP